MTNNNLLKNSNKKVKDDINAMASELGDIAINLNQIKKNYNWKKHTFVDKKKYQNYISKYIKQQSTPKKPLWEIAIDHIEKDLFN